MIVLVTINSNEDFRIQHLSCNNCSTSSCKVNIQIYVHRYCDECRYMYNACLLPDETSVKLLDMYKKEIYVKETVLHNIAFATSRHLIMAYLASWLHQPYVDEFDKQLLLQSLCKETGLT